MLTQIMFTVIAVVISDLFLSGLVLLFFRNKLRMLFLNLTYLASRTACEDAIQGTSECECEECENQCPEREDMN